MECGSNHGPGLPPWVRNPPKGGVAIQAGMGDHARHGRPNPSIADFPVLTTAQTGHHHHANFSKGEGYE